MLAIQVPTLILAVACAMTWQFESASFINSGEKTASTPADSASRASSRSSTKETSEGLAATIPNLAIHIPSFECWRPCKTSSFLSPPALIAREKATGDREWGKRRNKKVNKTQRTSGKTHWSYHPEPCDFAQDGLRAVHTNEGPLGAPTHDVDIPGQHIFPYPSLTSEEDIAI